MNEWTSMFLPMGVTLVIGTIGYFLKRSVFGKVDKCERSIDHIKEHYVNKVDNEKHYIEVKNDIKKIKEDYTPKDIHTKDFDECSNDIKRIKEDYITKQDFYMCQDKTDRKLDKIMDILLYMKGEK